MPQIVPPLTDALANFPRFSSTAGQMPSLAPPLLRALRCSVALAPKAPSPTGERTTALSDARDSASQRDSPEPGIEEYVHTYGCAMILLHHQ